MFDADPERPMPEPGFYFWICLDGWGYRFVHESAVISIGK
jgi:hypothetical protein